LAFLFVSQYYADSFEEVVAVAHETLGSDYTLLSIVGGGVIGDGLESDDPAAPAMSLLSGVIPASAGVEVFMFGPSEEPPESSSSAWNAIGRGQDTPSYIMFADPFSKIQEVINGLDTSGNSREEGSAVVAGGISCPVFGQEGPTVAINGKVYDRGTVVGVGLSGSLGLQAVVAQGCRPVGKLYEVTKGEENLIEELDHRPAVEVLAEIADKDSDLISDEDKKIIQTYGIMVGLATPEAKDVKVGDYLIRQILGFRSPSVMVGAEVKTGDLLKFHVRDPKAAECDMENMVGRAKTERMFSANKGKPLAALQISCVARGRALFGSPNVDINRVKGLFQENENPAAIGGFFANGEIGTAGIAGVGIGSKATHMHGFTTVACTICDFSTSSSFDPVETSTSEEDDSVWG
jgi:small ligand-binding sensory domain FIST